VPTGTTGAAIAIASCAGDCNGDGNVSIAELVSAVVMALQGGPLPTCVDPNGDGLLTINELVEEVHNAMNACA
jgi:hypothetical protein